MTRANPFPDYAVVTLKDNSADVRSRTISTEAIGVSRSFVKGYVDLWQKKKSDPTVQLKPLVVRVQGDYGTGKTHLLVDAAGEVERKLSSYSTITILKVPGLEMDWIDWFREAVRPQLKKPQMLERKRTFFKDVIIRLYAKAGRDVAAEANLTASLAVKLDQDYTLITKLIEENHLNITAVNQRFEQLLSSICQDVSDHVRKALGGIFLDQTEKEATAWLAGEEITEPAATRLGIPQRLTAEADVSGVLTALAAIHNYVDCPFGFMIDELEHLVRYDKSHGNKKNITWLKLLVGDLAKYKALIYVAGHDSAWDAEAVKTDFLDRFPPEKSIKLRKLTSDEILKIVRGRNTSLAPEVFSIAQAEVLATLTNGNIRRVLTICRVLFRSSSGFSQPITVDDIMRTAEELKQTISIEEATLHIREILENQRLTARPNGSVQAPGTLSGDIKFDLVGDLVGEPRVVVELKHAIDQPSLINDVRRFLVQMEEVHKMFPGVLGCFVADGNIDDELWSRLTDKGQSHLLWFDLSQRDVFNLITSRISAYLKEGQGVAPEVEQLEKLQAETRVIDQNMEAARQDANAGLIKELQEQRLAVEQQVKDLRMQMGASNQELEKELTVLENKRKAELAEIHQRLQLMSEMVSQRDAELIRPQPEEIDARLSATYSELIEPAKFSTRLRLAFSGRTFVQLLPVIIASVVLFLLAQILGPSFAVKLSASMTFEPSTLRYTIFALSFIPLIMVFLSIWSRITPINAFFDYSNRVLREMYVQSASPKDLVKANNILRSSLEEVGADRGRIEANRKLAREFPEVLGHLDDARPPSPPSAGADDWAGSSAAAGDEATDGYAEELDSAGASASAPSEPASPAEASYVRSDVAR